MDLLFVTATVAEAVGAGLLSEDKNLGPGDLIRLENKDLEGDLLITGVGQAATAYTLGKHLAGAHYELALNLGIAGSFTEKFPPGTTVRVIQDQFTDLGAESEAGFISLFDLGLGKPDEFPFKNGSIHDDLPAGFKKPDAKDAIGVTVNKVHGRADSIEAFRKRFPEAETESMEGAAFFYACRLAGQPCIQLRAISNFVEPRNRENWKIKEAFVSLKDTLSDWLRMQTIV